jgi:hypothetical protein
MALDPFSFRWLDTLVAAQMHRLTPAQPGPSSICLDRDVFDRLIAIAEVASQLQAPMVGNAELKLSHEDDLSYTATLEAPSIGSASANGASVLSAILAANRAFGAKIEERIR